MAIVLTFLFCALSFGVALACWVVADHRAWQRCYNYAVEQARIRDVMDPKGQAYSDMATVLVLGGRLRTDHIGSSSDSTAP